ncbi:hypothetical protein BKD85_06605 [Corynebacterium diphtheriae]|nr:hypothetical protein BKD84_10900 [Corynebacterium diphtheriae]OWM37396.1 hypothetical protein AZF05_04425 [Corynebacterium diphtheriae bv. intermedius]OWN02384.1 hypothetical protein AY473_04825 [Corynebacterium diphtheriae bv. mitis]OWN40526.1 hypothetical protein AY488_07380 [Corynebacterium belfantii]OFI58112.1 hypothetical protein BKD85_06605 [Corynebacterium diphtheriae]
MSNSDGMRRLIDQLNVEFCRKQCEIRKSKISAAKQELDGSAPMQSLFRLRISGAPLVELRVVPFEKDRFTVIHADVKDPVTVHAVTIEEIHRVMTLLFRQTLRNLGVSRIGKDELDIVFRLDPQARETSSPKIKRYTALLEGIHRVNNPGERPVRHLVFVTIDIKREGLFVHIRRLLRYRKVNRLMRKNIVNNTQRGRVVRRGRKNHRGHTERRDFNTRRQ